MRKNRAAISSVSVVLLLGGIALSGWTSFGATPTRRQKAAAAYHRAERLRVTLETGSNRSVAQYMKVVRAFELVYRIDPGYPKTPAALAAAAEVYEEMGRRFADDRYYSKSIAAYRFLISQYPQSALASDALLTIADIYRTGIENPEQARAAYQQFLKLHPHSSRTAEVKKRIAEIDRSLARWSRKQKPQQQPALAAQALPSPPQDEPNPYPGSREVSGIHDWVGPNYTRVVIRVDGPVKFNAMHLKNPPRLVFDLADAHLSPDLAKKVFPVENGFLQRVRIAQFKPDVARVVLDVPQIEDYSVFSLPNPFRLVIDIQGAKPLTASNTKLPARSTLRHSIEGRQALSAPRALAESAGSGKTPSSALAAPDESAADETPGNSEASETSNAADAFNPNMSPRSSLRARPSSAASAEVELSPPSPGDSLSGVSPTLTRALGLKIRRIVIDAGHGGHDTGTIGPDGLEEKNVVLDVALRLRKLIVQKMGCQVIMTRSNDAFIPLEERTAIANEYGADLFISIHANSSHDPSARGIETYYLNFTSDPEALALAARENATSRESVYQLQSLVKKIALSEKIQESAEFAKIVDHQFSAQLARDGNPQHDRGVKKAPFVVLIGANMPSILVEISFLSNPHDERLLRRGAYREKIAKALYSGIAHYVDSLGTIRVAQDALSSPSQHASPSF
ncbi:MAG TPA: N-acetylmuramoyl-L-alanine amidase [Terriglobia bacterium]|nr:N-acetylmuramoyl-L-alanine amidase [Terriglobia bacterium]